jgi:hypothetical protein
MLSAVEQSVIMLTVLAPINDHFVFLCQVFDASDAASLRGRVQGPPPGVHVIKLFSFVTDKEA